MNKFSKRHKVGRKRGRKVLNRDYARERGRNRIEINWPLLMITFFLAILAWFVGTIYYDHYIDILSRPMVIGFEFMLLFLLVSVTVLLCSILMGTFESNNIFSKNNGLKMTLLFTGVALIVFGLGALFQWIYGHDTDGDDMEPSSFVFLIDDSGSMEENDPEQNRYAAINTVISHSKSDIPYMIYTFADSTKRIREMRPLSENEPVITGDSYGMTSIRFALKHVLEDYDSGKWDGGKAPKVILLTDGYATDVGIFEPINDLLKSYAKKNISISTVGLGDVDKNLMNKISKKTGGVFIDVSESAQLANALTQATRNKSTRDLLSVRSVQDLNVLYGGLRIIFIIILGVVIGSMMVICYGSIDSVSIIIISSIIKSILGAFIMEIGTSVFGLSDKFAWLMLWICISSTLAIKVTHRGSTSQSSRSISATR